MDLRDEARQERETRAQMAFFLGHAPGDGYFPKGHGKPRAVVIGETVSKLKIKVKQRGR